MSAPLTRVDSMLTELLSELAKSLIAAGVQYPRFVGMSSVAFFNAAQSEAKFSNERLNHSAVAAMTGLTRVQVRRFAKQSDPKPVARKDRIESVIDGWTSDKYFTSKARTPLKLRIAGRGRSFDALVQRYGGDIPPRSVLRELLRHKIVNVTGDFVKMRPLVQESKQELRLRRLAKAIVEIIKVPSAFTLPDLVLQADVVEAEYPSSSDKGRVLLRRQTAEGLRALIERIQAAGIAASLHSPASKKARRSVTRTRVILISEEVAHKPRSSALALRNRRS
jgi:hypothetical protein